MTEQEWSECADPWPMLDSLGYLRGQVSNRKLRLLAVACCRRIWDQLADERSRSAVELAESYADGLADRKALVTAWRAASGPARIRWRYSGYGTPQAIARDTALLGVTEAVNTVLGQVGHHFPRCDLLREIFGNPFRPVSIDPTWRTPQALALARTAYEERCFEDLPILADALEEAGCADEAILSHLRGPGPHVRGCWVVDLVLGRS